jgi:tetratricopeptide (TPR) repeat protein
MSRTLRTIVLAGPWGWWLLAAASQSAIAAPPPATQAATARRLLIEGRALEASGNTAEASRRYARVIDACHGAGEVALIARGRLVPLLLDASPFDLPQARGQLDTLRSLAPNDPNLPDWQCRLALLELIAIPAAERETVWKRRLALLQQERPFLSIAGMRDLGRLLSVTGKAPLGDQVLVDLVLLFPDAETLAQLQLARAARFAARRAWNDASAAADFALLAASCSPRGRGPVPIAKAAAQLFAIPGAPADDVTRPTRWWNARSGRTLVDPALGRAARSALGESPTAISIRRRALLCALVGDLAGAARAAHDTLGQGFPSADEAHNALDDLTAALALADGSFADPFRLARLLAGAHLVRPATGPTTIPTDVALETFVERDRAAGVADSFGTGPVARKIATSRPGPAAAPAYAARGVLVRAWLGEYENILVVWGATAIASGEPDWAIALFAAAADVRPEGRGDSGVLQRIFAAAGADRTPDLADRELKLLGGLAPMLRSTADRRDVHTKIASVLLDQGKFQEALEELNYAGPAPETMSAGFTAALSLLRLERADEAVKRLESLEKLPGTDEEHARAMFLVGWIRLRDNDRARASAALERLVDRYPRTTAAKKAVDLLPAIEGVP